MAPCTLDSVCRKEDTLGETARLPERSELPATWHSLLFIADERQFLFGSRCDQSLVTLTGFDHTRLVPTRKTPTPEKTFCATAPPSSIAHLVGRIHRHGDVHTGQEVQERSAGAETYMQPSAGRPIPGQDATTRDQQPLCSTQPTGMRTVPRNFKLDLLSMKPPYQIST
ncbi:hypothetical protein PF005_g22400 [Phytophthora fragariae]|uniref:Uncharacterized protein n=1 Tax=Phytophthora fragariae TaxID=53985 RepID=A0A6A3WCR5_9STRA|nr:hypothetical protein PF006_g21566 [Phytophthora fragariae]KAE9182650.1 hypothetical protein PF005_g22400 [Phytophthora fragariae]